MLTCFLFAQHMEQDAILSVCLDMQGQIDKPLQMRSLSEIRSIQENSHTIVVLPSTYCSIHKIELPMLAEHKAREAMPFALEDRLAQSVNQLHFVFDKAHYHNKHYLVVVIEKQVLKEWMAKLQDLEIKYDLITIDWFALNLDDACILEKYILVNTEAFQGTLHLDIWDHMPHEWSALVHWEQFIDSPKLAKMAKITQSNEISHVWIARRLLNNKIMNLCQGEFQHITSQTQVKRWYQFSGYLFAAWFLIFAGTHFALNRMITHKMHLLDTQIAQSYHVFFPSAQQIINPKIRIQQLLKQDQMGSNTIIWTLLDNLSFVLAQDFHGTTMTKGVDHPYNHVTRVETLQFQNQTLTVTFVCDSFAALEKIEDTLRQRRIKVQQLSAATEKEQVVAKLELTV
ncbi:MAG TPA: type II secretion system protein GspL [Legionellaceae bacterium]|nr:type II secretion system protein GspL [Legionellaceae bacterium]